MSTWTLLRSAARNLRKHRMRKCFAILILCLVLSTSFADILSVGATIGPFADIQNPSSQLKKSLSLLKQRVESDAQDCLENAKGMGVIGRYNASFKKVLDTKKVITLEVSGSMICDGIHTSSYQYGIAFERNTGRRIDLSQIYNIAVRQDDHLFLRPELVDAVKTSYKQENKKNHTCLAKTDWDVDLTNLPITFSPNSDGSIVLYYAAPDISEACFNGLRLAANVISRYRVSTLASQYALP